MVNVYIMEDNTVATTVTVYPVYTGLTLLPYSKVKRRFTVGRIVTEYLSRTVAVGRGIYFRKINIGFNYKGNFA